MRRDQQSRIQKLLKDSDARQRALAPAKEVLEHVYRAMLALPEFTLKDGTKARLDPLVDPEAADDGQLQCGFDVLLGDSGHLEFMVKNTGWGRSLLAENNESRDGSVRGR